MANPHPTLNPQCSSNFQKTGWEWRYKRWQTVPFRVCIYKLYQRTNATSRPAHLPYSNLVENICDIYREQRFCSRSNLLQQITTKSVTFKGKTNSTHQIVSNLFQTIPEVHNYPHEISRLPSSHSDTSFQYPSWVFCIAHFIVLGYITRRHYLWLKGRCDQSDNVLCRIVFSVEIENSIATWISVLWKFFRIVWWLSEHH